MEALVEKITGLEKGIEGEEGYGRKDRIRKGKEGS